VQGSNLRPLPCESPPTPRRDTENRQESTTYALHTYRIMYQYNRASVGEVSEILRRMGVLLNSVEPRHRPASPPILG
jgi:hypothetical protein